MNVFTQEKEEEQLCLVQEGTVRQEGIIDGQDVVTLDGKQEEIPREVKEEIDETVEEQEAMAELMLKSD